MCIALDTSGAAVAIGRVGLSLAPFLLGGAVIGGAALIIGLHYDDFVRQ
ncbi:hypothetical protein NKI59_25210 [Mesorhizobium sp. M0598]